MRHFPLILALITPAIAGLTLPEAVKDYAVPADAVSTAEFSVDFPFTNASAAPLVIRKFNCACSGLRSEISGNKLTYAPGERIWSCRAGGRGKTKEDLYIELSGTSMAAPHVSGLLAAFLSVRREFIGYPHKAKEILLAHCTDLKRDRYHQSAGLPNLAKMLLDT